MQWLWRVQTPRHKFGIVFAVLTSMQKKKVWMGRLLLLSNLFLMLVVCVAAQGTESALARARRYEPHFLQAGQRYGVDPRLLWIVAYLESRFQPFVISPKGARGLMQFMPGTAHRYGLNDPHDADAAIDAAARYLRDLLARYGQRVDLALAAYNAGEGAVDAALAKTPTNGIPPYRETQSYVRRGLLMLHRESAGTIPAALSFKENKKDEREGNTEAEDEALLVLPRGVARQSIFVYANTEAASSQPQPQPQPQSQSQSWKRQSHYFGTRIDNASTVPPNKSNGNIASKASERQEEQ